MNTVQPIRDMEKLERIIEFFKKQSERNYVMFMIGIYTGLRISDILDLRVKDVKGHHISIREIKTGKEKRFIIIPPLRRILNGYISGREDNEYLIKSRNGENKPIHRSTAYRILNEAARQVNLKEIGTHTLRKTFGYHFYQSTKDVALLQSLFNHDSPKVTLRYIGVNQDTLDKAMMRFRYNFKN
ncbi:site-specific integrase [Mesobacillus thioparans]|uniref:site-specific integrase n=1 Tax=Mesobacillus thioparans TaxID=370439 RepID=UPI0039EF040C